MLNTAAKLRGHSSWDVETTSTVVALRTLARRAHAMLKEARELQKAIVAIIRGWRPDLLEEFGVGPIVAATVLCAWSHPGRIHSEAAFAMLAGVAPIPANSGQVTTRFGSTVTAPTQQPTAHRGPEAGSKPSQPPATTSPVALPAKSQEVEGPQGDRPDPDREGEDCRYRQLRGLVTEQRTGIVHSLRVSERSAVSTGNPDAAAWTQGPLHPG